MRTELLKCDQCESTVELEHNGGWWILAKEGLRKRVDKQRSKSLPGDAMDFCAAQCMTEWILDRSMALDEE